MNGRSLKILSEEHTIILSVLDSLEHVADSCDATGHVDETTAHLILRFIREFADTCHHGKEEDVLFAVMKSRKLGEDMVNLLVEEHQEGRESVRQMLHALDSLKTGSASAAASFVGHARDLIAMLRAHIRKEDEGAFPMAASVLSDKDDHDLVTRFKEVEGDQNRHAEAMALAQVIGEKTGTTVLRPSEIPSLYDTFIDRGMHDTF